MDNNTKKVCYALKKYYDNYRYYIIFNRVIRNIPVSKLAEKLNEKEEIIVEIEREGLERIKSFTEDDFVGYDTCKRFTPMSLEEICHCIYVRHYFIDLKNNPLGYIIYYQSHFNKMDIESLSALLNISIERLLGIKFVIEFNYSNYVGNMINNIVKGIKNKLLEDGYSIREIMNFNLEPTINNKLDVDKEEYVI